jgi:hypothetical protein
MATQRLDESLKETRKFLEAQKTLVAGKLSLNTGERFVAGADNLVISTWYNSSIFTGLPANLWFLGPGMALALIYGWSHWKLESRYLNSWEAHLEREADRLVKIRQFLSKINVGQLNLENVFVRRSLQNLITQIEAYANDTRQLTKKLGNDYLRCLEIEAEKEEQKKAEAIWIGSILGPDGYKKYLKLKDLIEFSSSNCPKKTNIPLQIPSELAEEKNALIKSNDQLAIQFINGSYFNMILSYALAYWFIYYVAVEMFKVTMPLSWGLLALTFPVVYLVYLEYTSYKQRLIEKDLSDFKDGELESEKNKRSSNLNFRYGWVFVALILAASVGGMMSSADFELAPVIILSTAVFASVLMVVKLIQSQIDHAVESAQKSNRHQKEVAVQLQEMEIRSQKRRDQLDEIALDAYSLSLHSQIADSNKLNKNAAKNTYKPAFNDSEEYSKDKFEVSPAAKVRLILSVTLAALLGYALGMFIGFAIFGFIEHYTSVFTGLWGNIITGVFSLVVAASFGARAYTNEKIHQNEVQTLSFQYQVQQRTLKDLDETLEQLRNELAEKANLDTAPTEEFTHPIRNEGVTSRKLLYGLRATIQVLVIAITASLLVRALLKMGPASLIPGLGDASMLLVGANVNPVAIVIISLIAVVFILKVINDVYLVAQQDQEKSSLARSDYDIKVKEAEIEYLQKRLDLISDRSVGSENSSSSVIGKEKDPEAQQSLDADLLAQNNKRR